MLESNTTTLLGALFAAAFMSATVLPGGSEAVFGTLLALHPGLALPALAVATLGNTLGGLSTYLLARLIPRKEIPARLAFVKRFGSLSLLLSWVPLIGDALCAAAGVLRLNWAGCLLWMAIGKGARYAAIAWTLT
ncbi:MAG: DedA family protein [Thauera sp.]|nr:DedA family protein [Thauera sp.]